ncbi:MAG: endonuclease III [Chloroflexota bacterium]|nr:endonuclease III [Chloroflexota bacterium]
MELQAKAAAIYQRLIEHYGQPQWSPSQDPVDELIWTILSANTTDVNSGRAFHQLKATFGEDWDAVRTAPLDAIKIAIRPAGMYNQKAPHIVATLEKLKQEQGDYTLDHLVEMEVAAALTYLTSFPGVGHKTASIVLLFCFNRAAFPVDTHIQRISQRLGISDRRASPARIKAHWEALLPAETFYALHVNLIRHGRTICQARLPRCEICPVQDWCDYFQAQGEWRYGERETGNGKRD